MSRIISEKIKRAKNSGVKVVIIDYALLNTSKIWKKFDYRICMFRDYEKRVNSVMERDGKTIEKILFLDSFSKYDIIKYGAGNVFKIYNNGSIEELKRLGNIFVSSLPKEKLENEDLLNEI